MEYDKRQIYRDELLHYGVLGMKWGRRRGRAKTKSNSSSTSNNEQPKKRRMSNKELQSRVKRLKLEQEYAKLTEVPQPQTVSKVEKLVKTAGTVAALSKSAASIYKSLNEMGVINGPAKKG